LRKDPDKAFDMKEIIEGTEYSIQVVMQGYVEAPESQFRHTLENLIEEGSIEARTIRSPAFYLLLIFVSAEPLCMAKWSVLSLLTKYCGSSSEA
jgi:hypothetical protein